MCCCGCRYDLDAMTADMLRALSSEAQPGALSPERVEAIASAARAAAEKRAQLTSFLAEQADETVRL